MTKHNRWFQPGVSDAGSDWAVHDQTEDFGGPEAYPRPWARGREADTRVYDQSRVDPAAYGIAEDDGLRTAPGRASWHRAADVNWQDRHEDGALRHRPGSGGRPAGMPHEQSRGYGEWVERRSQPVWPKGYTRSDERIRDDVCERLAHDGRVDLREVEVDVEAGVVTLKGSARDRGEKHRIENIAGHVMGVKDVQNQLRVG
ncbi:BON domain-containing protein [Cupriavidus pauculus]|uniref:BON domain-containing protein n=1 Tax=Cupriavidus pauculus TaxID=82633 RepID=A0A3G8H8L7_9BURK|nr:BON domain-containing protein [Cupriavidus pauculus]AZG16804.1 BON domain-containing protein [Cupriavidus pauculus]